MINVDRITFENNGHADALSKVVSSATPDLTDQSRLLVEHDKY